MNYFIESQNCLGVLGKAINLRHDRELKTKLISALRTARAIASARRCPDYVNPTESMPCGYQDAAGAELDAFYDNLLALRIAYDLSRGRGNRFMRWAKYTVGEY